MRKPKYKEWVKNEEVKKHQNWEFDFPKFSFVSHNFLAKSENLIEENLNLKKETNKKEGRKV